MKTDQENTQTEIWTWADMISTYRFWGLLLLLMNVVGAQALLSTIFPLHLQDFHSVSLPQLGTFFSIATMSQVAGFLPAWVASRWHPKWILIGLTALNLLSAPFVLGDIDLQLSLTSAIIFNFTFGAIIMIIPIILSGGRGGMLTFAFVFGLSTIVSAMGRFSALSSLSPLSDTYGFDTLRWVIVANIGLGLLFLLPTNGVYFLQSPRVRNQQDLIQVRSPIAVGLFSLIPIVPIYYLYRFHKEMASVGEEKMIPNAWIGLLVSLFPFTAPLILTNLVDASSAWLAKMGRDPLRRSWPVTVAGYIFFPVALGLVQDVLNQSEGIKE